MKINFWESPSRRFFPVFIFLSALLSGYFVFGIFTYPKAVFPPQHLQELVTAEFPVRRFTTGLFDLKQPADNHMIYEYVYGGGPNFTALSFYAVLFFIAIGCVLLLSVATSVSRLRFILSMGAFIIFLASLRLETLQIFGQTNNTPLIIVAAAYLLLAFCLHSLPLNFIKRVLAFTILTAMVACLIYFGARVKAPFLFTAAHATGGAMLITLFFILLIAHEVIAFFARLVSGVGERNLLHFLTLSAGYLCILLVAYLQKTGYIRWGIWVPGGMLLMVISAILGSWGYPLREPQHQHVFPNPLNVVFYFALLFISFGTLTFLYTTANDPGIDFFNDFVLYTHLGSGIIFFLYIIANFSPMLSRDLPVHKVLYKPTAMPYFSFRIASLIATCVFLVHHINWYQPYYYIMGSCCNSVAAACYKQGDWFSARTYYQHAVHFRGLNHQAHYAMARMAAQKLEPEKEKQEYEWAAKLNATPYTFLNLSETFQREGNTAGALQALRNGLKQFPANGDLFNGVGLIFVKNKVFDSALFNFQKAREFSDEGNTNLLACAAQMRAAFPADSLYSLTSQSPGAAGNALALANFQEIRLPGPPPVLTDSVLTAAQVASLANYFVNALGNTDTTLLNKTVKQAAKSYNENFNEYLLLAAAHAYYQQGVTRQAFSLVRQLAFRTGKSKYNKLLGLWSLEKQNPLAAYEYFSKIKDESANYFQAIALTEADSLKKALSKWKELPSSKVSEQTISMLENKTAHGEEEKFFYATHRIPLFDTLSFSRMVQEITAPEWKARAILQRTRRWLELDEVFFATRTFEKVRGLKVSEQLLNEIVWQNLRLVAANKNWSALQRALQNQKFDAWHSHDKIYYEALLAEQAGNREECVKKCKQLLTDDFPDEDFITTAVTVLMKEKERTVAFSQLSQALLQRPYSVRLLKSYVVAAIETGIQSEADEALKKLRNLLPPPQFNRFIETYPDLFSIQ